VQPQISFLEVIRDILPRDGFITGEMTQVGFTSQVAFPVYEPRTYVTCGHQDTLGYGFPTALGVKVANPDKAVISITGDGGFQFSIQELATAKQFKIGLITIIFNNSSFGNVRRDQETRFGGRIIGADLENPDFLAIARAYNIQGHRVRNAQELRDVLTKIITTNEPTIVEVSLATGIETSPWPFILRDAFVSKTVI
jgi:acetolactate synthase-1/2/3 large subunit